jgi:poly-gamma-glutamate synthesis protein (capsule biosynthesis protein)
MNSIALGFVGDVCFAGAMRPMLVRGGPAHCFEPVRPLFRDRDLICANLECCIVSDDADDVPKNVMRVPDALAQGMENTGIGIWSLCNNHVMDGGAEGLAITTRFLYDRGLHYFGAGVNRQAAEEMRTIDVRGRKVGFIGACDVQRYFASEFGVAGVAPMIADRLLQRVAKGREEVDLLVCTLHADLEFSRYPAPGRVRLSRALIEQGADLVVQHHPHVCQGIERYSDGLIAYSLGNFVFAVAGDPYQERFAATGWGMILYVDVEWQGPKKLLSWRVQPVTLDHDGRPSRSSAADAARQVAVIQEVSERLGDPRLLRREWWARCVQEARSTYYVLHHRGREMGLASAFTEAAAIMRDPYERRWMRGLLTGGAAG